MFSYAIMHLDRHVATIRSDGSCTVYYPRFMPYNLLFERAGERDLNARMNNLGNFYHWCATRLLTLDRAYAKDILNSLGMKQAVTDRDRADCALSYHALNLTDVYWVRRLHENIRFSDINLYDNALSDAFVDVSLRGRALTAENASLIHPRDFAGDVSTSGVAPKAWIRRGDSFFLLKDGSRKDVEAELCASQIARCFDVDQVLYERGTYDGQTVSICRLITSKEKSIVPAEYVEIYAANADVRLMDIVTGKDERGYHMMNIVDYLVGNTDRHWGNWGFWVNNADNTLGRLYPLMDFNKAFQAYDTAEGARCLTADGSLSQRDAALMAVRKIGLNQVRALPDDLSALFRHIDETNAPALESMFLRRWTLLKEETR